MSSDILPRTMAEPAEQVTLSHRQIQVVYLGLMAGMLLAALDQTIVATALPTIVGDLHGLNHLSWVVTAYLLTSTISVPLYGKVSDLYGRKIVFQFAIVMFLVGSVLCGQARSMIALVLFRGVQGIGGGGLMAMAQAIIGDIVPPRERGKYQGYLGAVFAFSSVVGPLLGGFIVDHFSWRWIFYVNVPVGLAALVITSIVLRLPFRKVQHRIDFFGAALVMGATSALLLVTVWGGSQYPWGSGQIIGLAATGIVLLALFFWQEGRAQEPIIPLRLWRNSIFAISTSLEFIVGFAMFGSIIFLPLYLQTVGKASAQNSGLLILPLMVGIVFSSITSGRLITRTGRYKMWPVTGTFLVTLGLLLFSTMGVGTSRLISSAFMVVCGLGMGMIIQVMVLAVQNSVAHSDLGTATATEAFARSMGGAFGVAVLGATLTNRLSHNLAALLPPGAKVALDAHAVASGPKAIAHLPLDVRTLVIDALAHSIHTVFLLAVPVAAVAFVLALMLPERPLRTTAHVGIEVASGEPLVASVEEAAIEADEMSRGAGSPGSGSS